MKVMAAVQNQNNVDPVDVAKLADVVRDVHHQPLPVPQRITN